MSKTSTKKIESAKEMKKEIATFAEAFILYLKNMGKFAKKIGEIEKEYPEAFKIMEELSSPQTLAEFVKKAPPEIVVKIFGFFLRASALSAKMKKGMLELTADEKIELGNEMIKLANDLSKSMKESEE